MRLLSYTPQVLLTEWVHNEHDLPVITDELPIDFIEKAMILQSSIRNEVDWLVSENFISVALWHKIKNLQNPWTARHALDSILTNNFLYAINNLWYKKTIQYIQSKFIPSHEVNIICSQILYENNINSQLALTWNTVLHELIEGWYSKLALKVIEEDIQINTPNNGNITPIMVATVNWDIPVLRKLVELWAKIDIIATSTYNSVFDYAILWEEPEAMNILLTHKDITYRMCLETKTFLKEIINDNPLDEYSLKMLEYVEEKILLLTGGPHPHEANN